LIRWFRIETALNEDQLSALQWLLFWEGQATNSSSYRIQGGNQKLLRTMYERNAGVIPDHLIQTQSALMSLKENNGQFDCVFSTPKGIRRISTKYLILALPITQLKKIEGLSEMTLAPMKKEAIQNLGLSSHVKVVLDSKETWGTLATPESLPVHREVIAKKSLMKISQSFRQTEVLWSFPEGQKKPSLWVDESLAELSLLYKKYHSNWAGKVNVMDWSQREWIQGATFQYKSNQFFKYRGIFSEPDFDGRLIFVGDYTHPTEWNTWAGALETGLWAADRISLAYQKTRRS